MVLSISFPCLVFPSTTKHYIFLPCLKMYLETAMWLIEGGPGPRGPGLELSVGWLGGKVT